MKELFDQFTKILNRKEAIQKLDEYKDSLLRSGQAVYVTCQTIVFFVNRLETNKKVYACVDAVFRFYHPDHVGLAEIKWQANTFIAEWK